MLASLVEIVCAYPRLDALGILMLLNKSQGKRYRDEHRAILRKNFVEIGLVRWDQERQIAVKRKQRYQKRGRNVRAYPNGYHEKRQ